MRKHRATINRGEPSLIYEGDIPTIPMDKKGSQAYEILQARQQVEATTLSDARDAIGIKR